MRFTHNSRIPRGHILKILLFILIIIFFVNSVSFVELLKHLTPEVFLWAIWLQPLMLLFYYLLAIRFKRLLTGQVSSMSSLKAVILTNGASLFLFAKSYVLLKPIYLKKKHQIPYAESITVVAVEQILDIIMLSAITLSVVELINLELSPLTLLLAMLAPFILLILIMKFKTKVISFFSGNPTIITKFIIRGIEQLSNLSKKGVLFRSILDTILIWTVSFVIMLIYIRATGTIHLSIGQILSIFVITNFATAIPSLPAGMGIFEAATVFSMQPFGYTTEEALAIAIGIRTMRYIYCLTASIYISFREDIGFKEAFDDTRLMIKKMSYRKKKSDR